MKAEVTFGNGGSIKVEKYKFDDDPSVVKLSISRWGMEVFVGLKKEACKLIGEFLIKASKDKS